MNKKLFLGLVFFSVLFSCTNTDCKTSSSLSFNNDIQPIFNENCATSGCHTTTSKAGGLDLSAGNSYAALNKAGSGYINTSNPSASLLYVKMTSTSNPMPPSGNLDKCTIDKILKWIEQGAKNN